MRGGCCTWKTPQERAQFKDSPFGLLLVVYIFTASAALYIDAARLRCTANSQSPASSQHRTAASITLIAE